MKFKVLVTLTFMALLLAFSFKADIAMANTFKEVRTIKGLKTNVYEKTDGSSKILDNPTAGTLVSLISKDYSFPFAHITYMNSDMKIINGYVYDFVLDYPKHTIKVASSKSGLVVKEAPSSNSNTVATLQHKMVVKDFGSVGNGWSYVQYGNVIGYAATNFMSESKPITKYVLTHGLVVRNIASPSGSNVKELMKYDEVLVHSTVAGWSYITSSIYEGYVVDSHLTSKYPFTSDTSSNSSSGELWIFRFITD
ncbi:SH3 domain-containing protein [Lysinibacillus sp. NPDC047702]|uniref:SH3 domain-containing protein n=1 Tax=unclassified Lysinibacillus TaxID=2636778 RepID=UPI003CFE0588